MNDFLDNKLDLGDIVVGIHANDNPVLALFQVVGFTEKFVELTPVSDYTFLDFNVYDPINKVYTEKPYKLTIPDKVVKI